MIRYHYVTTSAEMLAAATQIPKEPDAYIADEPETRILRELYQKGYRLRFLKGDDAVWEKMVRTDPTLDELRALGWIHSADSPTPQTVCPPC